MQHQEGHGGCVEKKRQRVADTSCCTGAETFAKHESSDPG